MSETKAPYNGTNSSAPLIPASPYRDAIERVYQLGAATTAQIITEPIYKDDGVQVHVRLNGPHGEPDLIEITRRRPDLFVEFREVDSFCRYICRYYSSEKYTAGPGAVFLSETQAVAILNHGALVQDRAILPLVKTPEHEALEKLFSGVSQKLLWSLLNSVLYDRVDEELLFSISTIAFESKDSGETSINPLGLANRKIQDGIAVQFFSTKDGSQQQTILKTEWTFLIPIWTANCGPSIAYNVVTRLEIVNKDGLLFFKFVPRQFHIVLQTALDDLKILICKGLPITVGVYLGEPGPNVQPSSVLKS